MHRIEKSIELDVPVNVCYDQWTQFESFPSFMEGVVSVKQIDDRSLHWTAEILGEHLQWSAEIVEQKPNELIAWRSTSGATNNGTVSFQSLGPSRSRITVELTYEPKGTKEKVGDALGLFGMRVAGDLRRFERFIEKREVPTGAWRGEIHHGQVTRAPVRDRYSSLVRDTTPAPSPDVARKSKIPVETRQNDYEMRRDW